MKMNNELRAPVSGTIESVSVSPGERVSGNALLIILRSDQSS
jgi:biotin carboxyl carrier protein